MTGEQERQHLVPHLLVGEGRAVLFRRLDQQAEDVLARLAGPSPAGDLAKDDPVQGAADAAQAGERAPRPAQHLKEVLALIERKTALEGRRDVDAGPIGVEPEQGAHRHPHRHMSRPVVEVHPVTRAPALERPLGLLGHDPGRGGDALAVKQRQHDPPCAVVVLAVRGQKAVADQRDQVAEAAVAPAELVAVGDEDEPVRLRAEHEHVDRVEDPDREDRSVLLVGREQH